MGNSALVLLSAIVNSFGLLLAGSFLAIGLGPEVYGYYISSIALATLISFFANLGITQFILKKFGQLGLEAYKLLRPSLQIIIFTSSISLCFIISLYWLVPSHIHGFYAILIMCFYLIGQVFTELMSSVYQLQEKYKKLSLLPLIPNFAKLICFGALLYSNYLELHLRSVSYVFFFALILLITLNIKSLNNFKSKKITHVRFTDPKIMNDQNSTSLSTLSILKESLPFSLTGLFHFVIFKVI